MLGFVAAVGAYVTAGQIIELVLMKKTEAKIVEKEKYLPKNLMADLPWQVYSTR